MAFTAENKADAYLFFVLAFNAAPGTVYGGQIVQAYEAGMTTADIVAQYVTKEQFLKLYPATQTNAEFAASLVANVSSAQTSATVKSAAEADIVTALAAGWTKAQVITQILGNLSAKSVADAEWGATVAQLNNKIEVAKVLTEGAKALNTTDVDTLTGPLKNVTEDVKTVQTAINGAGPLADKIDALNAATKAKADFLTAQKVNVSADITLKFKTAGDDVEKALSSNSTPVDGYSTLDQDGKETVSASTQASLVSIAKDQFAVNVSQTTLAFNNAKSEFLANTNTATTAELNTYLSAYTAAAAADKALTAATTATNESVGKLETATNDTVAITSSGTATLGGTPLISVESGALAVDSAWAATASAANVTLAKDLLAKIIAGQTATAADTAAKAAVVTAGKALFDVAANGSLTQAQTDAVKVVSDAQDALTTAQGKTAALDKAIEAYKAAAAVSLQDAALTKAVDDATAAFTSAGQKVPALVQTGTTVDADVFLVNADSAKTTLTGFASVDKIYAGKNYVLSTDVAQGDNSKLEVFFKANGGDTDVYIELKAFGSSTAGAADGNGDIVKVTLTGVAADKVALKDGFITVAA